MSIPSVCSYLGCTSSLVDTQLPSGELYVFTTCSSLLTTQRHSSYKLLSKIEDFSAVVFYSFSSVVSLLVKPRNRLQGCP